MKADTIFFCTHCGNESGKWLGQCPGCGEWNSYVEQPAAPRRKAAGPPRRGVEPVPVSEAAEATAPRLPTGLDGLDRVLGGGLVPGSLLVVCARRQGEVTAELPGAALVNMIKQVLEYLP